jgi:hypothetical protein
MDAVAEFVVPVVVASPELSIAMDATISDDIADEDGAIPTAIDLRLSEAIEGMGAEPPAKVSLYGPRPRFTYWQPFQSGHGWAVNPASAASNLNDTTQFALGTQSVKLVTNGQGTNQAVYRFGFTALDMTNKQFAILVKIDNPDNMKNFHIWAGTGSPNPYFAFWGVQASTPTDGSHYLEAGKWVWIVFPWQESLSGSPNRAAITAIQLNVGDTGTAGTPVTPVTAHIQAIATVPTPSAGAVMIDFDDGFSSQVDAINYLGLKGFPCNIWPVQDQVENHDAGTISTGLSTIYLQQVQANFGCLIGLHSDTWAHHNTALGAQTEDEVALFFRAGRKWLTDRGFNGADFIAYPGGHFDEQTLGIARKYTAYARTVDQRQRETLPPGDPHKARISLTSVSTTAASMTAAVDAAIAGKYLVNFVFHAVDGTGGVSLATFKTLVDYLVTVNANVITAAGALKAT